MINITGKTNGKPVSSLSIDLLTPSTKMKVVAVALKNQRSGQQKEATALYEYTKEMENLVSCITVKSIAMIDPVEMEFNSIESALAAKAKLDTLSTNNEWNGWVVYCLFWNTPVTNPLPPN